MVSFVAILATCLICAPQAPANTNAAAWEQQARNITITRDDYGIPHIHGKTDADAVFGLIYAQAEDDFNRVETNYLSAMGRLAEAEGESAVYRDLRMKLFIAPDSIKAQYAASPDWLKKLMNAWADGLNFFLYKHPDVKPKVITRFEPWMALTFSEGSIGGDIESISLRQLEAFYGKGPKVVATEPEKAPRPEPTGSNGFAIAPANSASQHALLLINPHTSFFFRAEVQVASDEGLNAYGAVTWGQFFVYQGFNEHAGWMHTSSGVDNIDEYAETVVKKGDGFSYRHGSQERPVTTTRISVPYKSGAGLARKEFTVYRTHHGPVVREADGKWVSVTLMEEPVKALTQSYTRTKARNYQAFKETMQLHTNSSNNTIFADSEGNIAYFHANFIPRRDTRFDWSQPVDGSNPATDWQAVLSVDETPGLLNPSTGWLYNTNNAPWSAAGPSSPKQTDYPSYVETGSQNFRGIHALGVLSGKRDFTLASLISAAYDSYLPAFEALIPSLVDAYDQSAASDPLRAKLAEPIELLRGWDFRCSVSSVSTSLAVYFGEALGRRLKADAAEAGVRLEDYIVTKATARDRLESLSTASDSLTADFGRWDTPWGEINRFQRLTGEIAHPFDDAGQSIPVGFTSADWGSLAAFETDPHDGAKKRYGTSGNSFVAVVEFGDSVRAKAVTAGGESGHPNSPHFDDQAMRYSTGDLRDVYFYASQLTGHTERRYHPGE